MESFLDRVLRSLPGISHEDLPFVKEAILKQEQEGYSVLQSIRTCLCMEEVSPNLDESTALKRMSQIRAHVLAKKPNLG